MNAWHTPLPRPSPSTLFDADAKLDRSRLEGASSCFFLIVKTLFHRSPSAASSPMGAACSHPHLEQRGVMDRILEAMFDPEPRRARRRFLSSRRRRSASPQGSHGRIDPSFPHGSAAKAWEARERRRKDADMEMTQVTSRYVASPVVSDYAAVSTQNSKFRKHMEDECVAIPQFRAFSCDPAKSSFFGVYDGHGGDFCAKYAAKHFHHRLAAIMEERFSAKRFESECSTSSNTATSSMDGSEQHFAANTSINGNADVFSSQDMERCYAEAFEALDKELEQFDESACSGSTAVTCLIRKHNGRTTFHVANVGDSRAVFFANGRTSRLSVDHKATNEDEVKRIRELNGIIFNKRVAGSISVTRALGQADEKRFITSSPHVESVDVESGNAFLMLVSDGVSDVFSDEELTAFVSLRLSQRQPSLEICKELLEEAKQQGSMDNMTAVLVCFGDGRAHSAPCPSS